MKEGGAQPYFAPGDDDLADPATIGDEAARRARSAEVRQRSLGSGAAVICGLILE
jgi:hypothetical protein